jgi:hypothetical protein
VGDEAWGASRESTARVLGRIHIKHIKEIARSYMGRGGPIRDRTELVASLPGTFPTTLVLPGHLTDAAKLALIDLNPADHAVRSTQTLYWCADAGAWLSKQNRAERGCPTCQHPDNRAMCSPDPEQHGRRADAWGQTWSRLSRSGSPGCDRVF